MSYGSVLSLAGQSARWEHAMNVKILELTAATVKAASFQASAAEHQSLAAQAQKTAAGDEAEAAELQEEAAVLTEQSNADAAVAAGEQAEVEELEAQVVGEEEEAAAHAAAAALDETTFDSEMAEATADAVQATRSEAQAHGEEVGIGVCEFVPFLDIACDIIGGITAVGMEGIAASEAMKASGELAAATATKTEEEREVAQAAEFQGKVTEDGAAAAELQGDEAAEAELAEEEWVTGEEKEAEADALIEQAEAEEETAAEEESAAAEQEDEAALQAANAVVKGVMSCWDAIMASFFGAVSFLYFTFRFAVKVVPPTVSAVSTMWASPATTTSTIATAATGNGVFVRNLSYNLHHCGIFALVAGNFSNLFHVFEHSSLQARGGIILAFGFTGACVQTILLHSLPGHLSKSQSIGSILLHGLRFILSLPILYTLEILIVWAALGRKIFSNECLQALDHWQWWVLFLLPLGLHWSLLEIPMLRHASIDECSRGDESLPSTETDALLSTKHVADAPPATATESTTKSTTTKGWFHLLWEDLGKMQFPFEILLLTCMSGLLIHCLGAAGTLWPASKALLLSHRPDWLIPLGIAAAAAVIFGLAWPIICGRRNNAR